MIDNVNIIDWPRLIQERDEWIAHNFPNRSIPDPGESIMGMIEELGELTHALLKQSQSIRGTSQEHDDAAQDAVGDITVYMLGVMSFSGWPDGTVAVEASELDHGTPMSTATCVGAMCYLYEQGLSRVRYGEYIDRVINNLWNLCAKRGWDYALIVNSTWEQVRERDWIEYPQTGRPVKESNLVVHARRELELIGQFKEDEDFAESIVAAISEFASYGHSGGSAEVGVSMVHELLQFRPLSELTDDPSEWVEVKDDLWQNSRNGEAFSDDGGKTYTLVNDPDRTIHNTKRVQGE